MYQNTGFTLIELLVVVLIIGILSAVALPQYSKAVEKSRLTEVLANIHTMQNQLDLYVLSNGLPSSGLVDFQDITTVDLSGGSWNRGAYITKNYNYYGVCGSEGCSVEVLPADSRREVGIYYDLYATTSPIPDYQATQVGNWYQVCASERTDIGRVICKSLESQGWGYNDADL